RQQSVSCCLLQFHNSSFLRFRNNTPGVTCVVSMCLTFFRARGEILEHLRYTFVEVLFIFIGLVRQRIFGTSAPDQLLRFCVEHVDYERSFLVVLLGGRRLAEPSASESSPAPSPHQSFIAGLKCSITPRGLYCPDAL